MSFELFSMNKKENNACASVLVSYNCSKKQKNSLTVKTV